MHNPEYWPMYANRDEEWRKVGAPMIMELGSMLVPWSPNERHRRHGGRYLGMAKDELVALVHDKISEIEECFANARSQSKLRGYFCRNRYSKEGFMKELLLIMAYVTWIRVVDGPQHFKPSDIIVACHEVMPEVSLLEWRRKCFALALDRPHAIDFAVRKPWTRESLVIGHKYWHEFIGRRNLAFPLLILERTEARNEIAKKEIERKSKEASKVASEARKKRYLQKIGVLPVEGSKEYGYSPKAIEARMKKYVVGNNEAVRTLATRLAIHCVKSEMIRNKKPVDAPNEVVLVVGSSSSGKSYLVNTIPSVLRGENGGVPFFSCSAPDFTETGYVGMDVECIPNGLLKNANGDEQKARCGVAFIDEFDKRASASGHFSASGHNISAGFQYGLLKIIEGSTVLLNSKRFTSANSLEFNTLGSMFILGGAFDGLDKFIRKQAQEANSIGFVSQARSDSRIRRMWDALAEYGVCRQILSRVTSLVVVKDPSIEELKTILTFPNGVLAAYAPILQQSEISLELSEDAKNLIAEFAFESKTFARGMKRVVSRIIETVLYEGEKGDIVVTETDMAPYVEGEYACAIPTSKGEPEGRVIDFSTEEPQMAMGS